MFVRCSPFTLVYIMPFLVEAVKMRYNKDILTEMMVCI